MACHLDNILNLRIHSVVGCSNQFPQRTCMFIVPLAGRSPSKKNETTVADRPCSKETRLSTRRPRHAELYRLGASWLASTRARVIRSVSQPMPGSAKEGRALFTTSRSPGRYVNTLELVDSFSHRAPRQPTWTSQLPSFVAQYVTRSARHEVARAAWLSAFTRRAGTVKGINNNTERLKTLMPTLRLRRAAAEVTGCIKLMPVSL